MRNLPDIKKRVLIKVKDHRINKNINAFIKKYQHTQIQERETSFSPEILIPCYNHGNYLEDAVASIPKSISITIINDASDDDTGDYIERLAGKCDFKLITNQHHLYQTGSLNKAVSQSENNFFIVLNADDVLLRYWPITMLNLFGRYPTIRLAGGNSISFCKKNTLRLNDSIPSLLEYNPDPRIVHPENARHYTHLNSINMTMSGCTFLRSSWEAIDGFWDFPQRVCSFDDRDFQMRTSALFDIAILDEPSAFYRINSSQQLGQS
jgi:glycosyltransferase involved in cell wall biosynthesis